MVARLPVPGQDDDGWALLLNEYLLVEHDAAGHHTITGGSGSDPNALSNTGIIDVDAQSGSTDDAKLANAITALTTRGRGVLLFRDRTYTITSATATTVINMDNVVVMGMGRGLTVFNRTGGTGGGIWFGDNVTQRYNCAIMNMTLKGRGSGGGHIVGADGVRASKSSRFRAINVEILDWGASGLHVTSDGTAGQLHTIRDCVIHDNYEYGLLGDGGYSSVIMTDGNQIYGNGHDTGGLYADVLLNSCNEFRLSGDNIYQSNSSALAGYGIRVYSCGYGLISGATINGYPRAGIDVGGNSRHIGVHYNDVIAPGSIWNGAAWSAGPDNIGISLGRGDTVGSGTKYCQVTHNDLSHNGSNTLLYGVEETGYADENEIEGNGIDGKFLTAVKIVGANTLARSNGPRITTLTPQAIANGGTITHQSTRDGFAAITAPVSRTGIRLQAGIANGDEVRIVNMDAVSFTFDTPNLSLVASEGATIEPNQAARFLWYRDYAGVGVGRWLRMG